MNYVDGDATYVNYVDGDAIYVQSHQLPFSNRLCLPILLDAQGQVYAVNLSRKSVGDQSGALKAIRAHLLTLDAVGLVGGLFGDWPMRLVWRLLHV